MNKIIKRSYETKQKLLTAAREIILEKGWALVSTRAIARRAGVNLALINYHFGGKKKLLAAMLNNAMQEIFDNYSPVLARDNLPAFMQEAIWIIPKAIKDPTVRVMAMAFEAIHDKELSLVLKKNLNTLRSHIEDIARASGIEKKHVKGLTAALAALLDGLMHHLLIDSKTDIKGAAKIMRITRFCEKEQE